MAKDKITYQCTTCGWESPKWVGQCRQCQAWSTLEECVTSASHAPTSAVAIAHSPSQPAQPISTIDGAAEHTAPSGVGEFDRILGGGIVPGAVILLAGEPGIGKSTLLLDVAGKIAQTSQRDGQGAVLYVTGEESCAQVKSRAQRIGAISDSLLLADEAHLSTILGHIQETRPSLLIVDSIQTAYTNTADGSPGGVNQVRAVTAGLIHIAKELSLPVILVGHVTKDGGIAGPRVLEHLVDVVCQFDGDRHSSLRLLRAVKNRYGPTDEVGCFELTDTGIHELSDPSGLFLSSLTHVTPGSCVTVTLEGRRPMPIEIQALVTSSGAPSPRRATSGTDYSRTSMVLAVLQARLKIDTSRSDVYVSTVGGARGTEPSTDLASAIAVVSSVKDIAPHSHLVAMGEVGLTGELRACAGIQRRLQEAVRLGFTRAIVPEMGSADLRQVSGLNVIPVSDLATALRLAMP